MTIQLPPLEPWQRDLFDIYEANEKGKIIITKAVRQVGKSICLSLLVIAASFKEPRSESKVVLPIYKQAEKAYDKLCEIGAPLITKQNASGLKVTFINGSTVEFSSAESGDNLRGFTVRRSGILAIDEASFIDSDFFYSVLLPMTNVFKSNIFIFSTPKARQGFFYDLFEQGTKDDPKIISVDWTKYDTSKFLDAETLEIYRKKLPRAVFRSEYLGEWLETNESVFADFQDLFIDEATENGVYYFGIDWSGQGQCDYTAISIFNSLNEMVDIVYFNDLDETETLNKIIELAIKYKPKKITVETNSIGNIYYGLLQKAVRQARLPIIVQGFVTTNDSKDEIISALQVAIQNKDIRFKRDDELERELNNYQLTFSKTGKRVFNSRSGFHDDLVIATAICLNSMKKGQYTISII